MSQKMANAENTKKWMFLEKMRKTEEKMKQRFSVSPFTRLKDNLIEK